MPPDLSTNMKIIIEKGKYEEERETQMKSIVVWGKN